jgi:hypothetical protein
LAETGTCIAKLISGAGDLVDPQVQATTREDVEEGSAPVRQRRLTANRELASTPARLTFHEMSSDLPEPYSEVEKRHSAFLRKTPLHSSS